MKNISKNKLDELITILRKLRSPDGCDWDKKQTSKSLIPFLLEETYELIEAIENEDHESINEELGDLLLHIVFQTELANEKGYFSIENVIDDIKNKLIKRHPHVFSKEKKINKNNWELAKQKEKKRASVLDGVPKALPALARSFRIQEKAASIGFNWDGINLIWNKIDEELKELKEACALLDQEKIEEEIGDLLFTVVNLSRFLDINSEQALKVSILKFEKRFNDLERKIKSQNNSFEDYTGEELLRLWKEIK